MANYIGDIILFAGNFAINGFEPCDGRLLPIAEYQPLYALIGTTYGGDGVTTFAVPDLRGRAPVHQGTAPGMATYVAGQLLGSETVSLQAGQYPAHTHTVSAGTAPGAAAPGGGVLAGNTVPVYGTGPATIGMASAGIEAAQGGGQPHDNMAPFLALNYQIAVVGMFPSAN